MANAPTDKFGYLDIADLLESEELKAKEKIAQQKAEANGNANADHHMRGTSPIAPSPANSHDLAFRPTSRQTDSGLQRRSDADRDLMSSGRYLTHRELEDERRARRYVRNQPTDDESDSKYSANGSVRSRRRSRSPRNEGRRGHRSRDRADDHYYPQRDSRGRAPRFENDSYRPGGDRDRRGARSRTPPRCGGARDDRDRRVRDYYRSQDRRHSYRDGGNKRKTPEPTDDERDRRTVFVQQLAARLRSRELRDFFEQVGPVVDAQIVKDRVSGRSKGVGYVEFKDEESVQKAIGLTGQKLLGIPIIAQLTEAEKNRQARTTEGTATQSNGIPFHRLYVGNIHFSITEADLKNVFEPFGELEFAQLQKEEAGRSKGYGFVQFIDPAQAKEALEKMNGFELAGRPIRVGLGNDKFTAESTQSLLQRFGPPNHSVPKGSAFSGLGGRGAHAGGTGNFDRPAAARDVDKTGGASALDDSDVGGVNFSNYSRNELMTKLLRVEEPEQKIAPKTQVKKSATFEQPSASRCVLIKNMYNQNEETEPNWQKELKDDVKAECEGKYGKVVHIDLALDNNDGEVYVKFDRVQGGENAFKGLNGRWFGGRMLTAQYVVDAVYTMNFPKAANV